MVFCPECGALMQIVGGYYVCIICNEVIDCNLINQKEIKEEYRWKCF